MYSHLMCAVKESKWSRMNGHRSYWLKASSLSLSPRKRIPSTKHRNLRIRVIFVTNGMCVYMNTSQRSITKSTRTSSVSVLSLYDISVLDRKKCRSAEDRVLQLRLDLNLLYSPDWPGTQSFCLSILGAGIIEMCYYSS